VEIIHHAWHQYKQQERSVNAHMPHCANSSNFEEETLIEEIINIAIELWFYNTRK
jgi:hypothetical protein